MSLCECGCGLPAPITTQNNKNLGLVKGEPRRFIVGHNGRKQQRYIIHPETGCWEWLLGRRGDLRAYGGVFYKGKTLAAHRFYYEKYRGLVPEGLELDHICKNKICVNPWHLEPVTHAENSRRAVAKLTREQVEEIKNTDFTRVSKAALGRKFGVSRHTVSKVVFGVNWTSV